jgi:hypothetical protein
MNYKPTLPSGLLAQHGSKQNGTYNHEFGNFGIKTGVIIKTHEIDSKENLLGVGPEYDVVIHEQDGNRGTSSVIYKNCQFLENFGGISDFLDVKRREPTNTDYKVEQDIEKFDGAMVLMACIDGVSNKGIIIGAITNPNRKSTLTKEAGAHMEQQFNGLNWQVNKDGAYTVTFNSAMDNKGKKADEEAAGTSWKIEKDGSTEFSDGNKESIRLDKTEKTITVNAEKDISITSEKENFSVTAKKSVNITAGKDLIAMAEGKAAFTISKTLDIETKGATSVKTKQLSVESKTMIQMKAQSLIELEAASYMILKAPTVLIGPAPAQPALLAYDLITLGTGNLGAPVISQAIAGYSTSVIISY